MARRRAERGRRSRRDAAADIPTGSFSDIAFLLIIFFLVATTLIRTKGIATEFPAGQENKAASDKNNTVVIGPADLKFNDKAISMRQLRRELMGMKLAEKRAVENRMIVVESAPSVVYERYFQVMVAIERAGGIPVVVQNAKKGGG